MYHIDNSNKNIIFFQQFHRCIYVSVSCWRKKQIFRRPKLNGKYSSAPSNSTHTLIHQCCWSLILIIHPFLANSSVSFPFAFPTSKFPHFTGSSHNGLRLSLSLPSHSFALLFWLFSSRANKRMTTTIGQDAWLRYLLFWTGHWSSKDVLIQGQRKCNTFGQTFWPSPSLIGTCRSSFFTSIFNGNHLHPILIHLSASLSFTFLSSH